jgi:hypothetical protein
LQRVRLHCDRAVSGHRCFFGAANLFVKLGDWSRSNGCPMEDFLFWRARPANGVLKLILSQLLDDKRFAL